MPFTPSHAVVALPFVRTPLIPAAVAIGAMAPDLPIFVRGLPLHYGRTHDLAWLPATLALALFLLLVWRAALRPAVRELSPGWLAQRLPEEWDRGASAAVRDTLSISAVREPGMPPSWKFGWGGMLLLLVSLVIGIVSHVVWDLFTHDGRGGVEIVPLLAEQWGPLLGYKWLQHGSSFLGLAIIGAWAALWLKRRDAAPLARVLPNGLRWAWWISLPVTLVIAWVACILTSEPVSSTFTLAHVAYRAFPPACAVWGSATLLLCLVVQGVRRARSRVLANA